MSKADKFLNTYNPNKNIECVYIMKLTLEESNIREYTEHASSSVENFIRMGYDLKYTIDMGRANLLVWVKTNV